MDNHALGPILCDLEGLVLTEEEKALLLHPQVGGIIFFSRNYESPEQLCALVNSIRRIRPSLLLTVDQEGGRVQRFVKGLSKYPPLRALSHGLTQQNFAQKLELADKLAQLMALEVRSLGVDLSFAPVLDRDIGISQVIGNRAFHSDPECVSALGAAYVKGMSKIGMQAVGKHFPGHGSVSVDSHHGLPEDTRSYAQLSADMAPFKHLIAQKIPGIMPAHIVYPQIDPDPVGFSTHWLQNILRKECGFEGTIISDDLTMEGAACIGDYPTRAQRALAAGCDYILVCNNRSATISILEALENMQILDSLQTQKRRQNLLAQGQALPYADLHTARIWKEAYAAMEQVERMQNPEECT